MKVQDASYSDGGKINRLSEYLSLPAREKASIAFSSNQIVFTSHQQTRRRIAYRYSKKKIEL